MPNDAHMESPRLSGNRSLAFLEKNKVNVFYTRKSQHTPLNSGHSLYKRFIDVLSFRVSETQN